MSRSIIMVSAEDALPGRALPLKIGPTHAVLGSPMEGPWPEPHQVVAFGMGCFWGAERIFWQLPGVIVTAAGYQAGYTPNPTYEEVCSGGTGHAEVVRVVWDPSMIGFETLLAANGFGQIATEIVSRDEAGPFSFAEEVHQGYLHKNPGGYCNHGFCQVAYADADAN